MAQLDFTTQPLLARMFGVTAVILGLFCLPLLTAAQTSESTPNDTLQSNLQDLIATQIATTDQLTTLVQDVREQVTEYRFTLGDTTGEIRQNLDRADELLTSSQPFLSQPEGFMVAETLAESAPGERFDRWQTHRQSFDEQFGRLDQSLSLIQNAVKKFRNAVQ